MLFDHKDTLSYHLDLPHRKATPFGDYMRASDIKDAVRRTHAMGGPTGKMAYPDFAAAQFYSLNQLVAIISLMYGFEERLPPWASKVCEEYAKVLAEQTCRMFHYVLLIITREVRHLHSKASFYTNKPWSNPPISEFLGNISGGSSGAADEFMSKAPKALLSTYVNAIARAFNTGSFGGGYGGKPWGNIATTLHAYVSGQTSAEVFVDTAYTLAHNNGPIFNKSMYYHGYTAYLAGILDVQRSGQVCELVLSGQFSAALNNEPEAHLALKKILQTARGELPEGAVGSYVDWVKVEALGSLHKYPQYLAEQKVKHGLKPEAPKAPVVETITLGGQVFTKDATAQFYFLPSKTAQIYKRKSTKVT